MIKAVLFDIDGVLVDSYNANKKFFEGLLKEHGYPKPSKEKVLSGFHLNMLEAIKIMTGAHEEKVIEIWKRGYTFPYPVHLLKVPKDALPAVKNLKKMYKLGVVTSRIKPGIKRFYDVTKMDGLFDVLVGFEDTKSHKPHPEPLLLACKRLKVNPSEAVYVGDAPSDYQAARAAGMKFISYSKKRMNDADARIKDFSQLQKAIKSVENVSV